MGALRCPMCCKRKFKTQMSLKYHILSYMYNIFCTLCSKRVGNMQELIDHLEAGCDKAYSASLENVPAFKHVMVQTQEEMFETKAVQVGDLHESEDVQVEEVEGPLSASSSDEDSCTWSGSDCEGDKMADLPDDHVQTVRGVEGCNTSPDTVLAGSECNTSEGPCKAAVAKRTSPRQLFTCNVCHTTFTSVEEHVKLYHSEQDVEVHRRDSSIMHFGKSKWKGPNPDVNDIKSVSSTAQDCRDSMKNTYRKNMAQTAANNGGVSKYTSKINNSLGKILNCDSSSNTVGNEGATQCVQMSLKPVSNCTYENNRNVIYRNNRDTEHAYSTRRVKDRPYRVQPSRSFMYEQPGENVGSDKGKGEGDTSSNSAKDKMLCVCNPSNHQHSDKEEHSAAIEFSEAIPKLFSQKNGKEVPTVVVFNGNKLTSILTPMTSSINLKSLQRCTSLVDLVSAIGCQTQKTYPRSIVKSTGESVYRDSSGMFYARKLISSSDAIPSSSVEPNLKCSPANESIACLGTEINQQIVMNSTSKHKLETACIRKRIRNEREFIIKKSVDSNGKFLDNIYTCRQCRREFRKYLTFCKHSCEKEANTCSCPDCDNQFAKKRILTIHFKDIDPEVDSQKAMIEIGLGVNTEPEVQTTEDNGEDTRNVQNKVTDITTKDGSVDVNCKLKVGKRPRKIKPPKKVSTPQTMVCNICSTVFTKRVAFVGHQRMHAPKVARIERNADGTPVDYTCKICSFVAEHRRGYNQHMRVHFPEEYERRRAERREKIAKEAELMVGTAGNEQEAVGENNDMSSTLNLSCKLCGEVFSKRIHLDEHVRAHYNNVGEYVAKESMLVDAVVERAIAAAPHTFTCEICSKTLDIVFRQLHIKTHLGDERFTCEICNENLYTREQFNLHMRAHKGDNPYLCRVCRKKFSSLEDLEKHVLSHNGPKRYACRFCDRWFKRPCSKVEHERLHTGEKPFSCSYCGMKFRLKGTRELHIRIHTGLKPYCCQVCKKRFRSKFNMRAHVAIHSDERNYKCSICPKTFKTAVSLSSHKNYHTKPYKCPICQRRFETSYSEKQHRLSHSNAKSTLKYKCSICGIMYARPFGLRDHMLTHVKKTEQPSELEDGSCKSESMCDQIEIVDDECTQTADLALADVDECMEAAEYIVVDSNECFQTSGFVVQVENEATSEFIVDELDEAGAQNPEFVAYVANEDKDYPGSVLAVTDDFTAADGYLIAGDSEECQQSVELLVVEASEEDASASQYILAAATEESVEVPQLELSDIYNECELSGEKLQNQDLNRSLVDFSDPLTLVSINEEGNACVPPVPVNFEEVKTEVDIDELNFSC